MFLPSPSSPSPSKVLPSKQQQELQVNINGTTSKKSLSSQQPQSPSSTPSKLSSLTSLGNGGFFSHSLLTTLSRKIERDGQVVGSQQLVAFAYFSAPSNTPFVCLLSFGADDLQMAVLVFPSLLPSSSSTDPFPFVQLHFYKETCLSVLTRVVEPTTATKNQDEKASSVTVNKPNQSITSKLWMVELEQIKFSSLPLGSETPKVALSQTTHQDLVSIAALASQKVRSYLESKEDNKSSTNTDSDLSCVNICGFEEPPEQTTEEDDEKESVKPPHPLKISFHRDFSHITARAISLGLRGIGSVQTGLRRLIVLDLEEHQEEETVEPVVEEVDDQTTSTQDEQSNSSQAMEVVEEETEVEDS
jgi:hypothetical protein